jgi:hypothetical protein
MTFTRLKHVFFHPVSLPVVFGIVLVVVGVFILPHVFATTFERGSMSTTTPSFVMKLKREEKLDTKAYDAKMLALANVASTTGTSTPSLWPVTAPYPKAGAILPFKRIVAYYGNFYSTKMGVLGEYEESVMLEKLRGEKRRWEEADPTTPVMPAINYIAITAQGSPGKEGKYLLRMPDDQIDYALTLADKVDGIVILDIQIGLSNLEKELPLLEKYLAMPNVHLGLDPEFHMITGDVPGDVIGSYDAKHINYAANYLANLVKEHNLPPKVLIVHRFTQRMVTNAEDITPLPEVQIVMDMDGWGPPAKKINTYKQFIYPEPVQFTGFKLFYKNDLKPPSDRLLTPSDLLKLTPQPSFIQYQ